MEQVKVFAPATVANVSCAFDILGFAVESIGDTIVLKKSSKEGLRITKIGSAFGDLPFEVEKNCAAASIQAFLDDQKIRQGIEIEIYKGIPFGGGMGSSAASSAAGVFAANLLCESPLKTKDLVLYAMEGERAACGSAHADNVTPALLGGFAATRSYSPLDVFSIPFPSGLAVSLIYPHVEVRTQDARKVLKKEISLKLAVQQFGNIAGLVSGLCLNDLSLISRSLVDVIIEPERADLIPFFYDAKQTALDAGALGCGISGSGPSIFALCENIEKARAVSRQVERCFSSHDIRSTNYTSPVSLQGARVVP